MTSTGDGQLLGTPQAAAFSVVASANPGCSFWLAAAGVDVGHPVELVATALEGRDLGGR